MPERMEWNGRKYRRYPDAKGRSERVYWHRSKSGGGVEYLHRDVWAHHHGAIPDGHHVHHVDGDPSNNAIENLECISPAEHLGKRHPYSDERRAQQAARLERIRPLASAWHRSDEGRELHRRIGPMARASFVPVPKPCMQCAAIFSPRKIGNADLFCSNACKSAHRRASGVDNEQRICAECNASFTTNRYAVTATCSRSCGARARGRTIAARLRPDG